MKPTILAVIATIIVDQATKWYALYNFPVGGPLMEVVPGWLSFGLLWNHGLNFGLLGGMPDLMRGLLIAFAFAVLVFSLRWAPKLPSRATKIALGCFAGGGAANALDRIIHGAVVDFLNVTGFGIQNPFFFNLADVAIVAGIGILFLLGTDKKDEARSQRDTTRNRAEYSSAN